MKSHLFVGELTSGTIPTLINLLSAEQSPETSKYWKLARNLAMRFHSFPLTLQLMAVSTCGKRLKYARLGLSITWRQTLLSATVTHIKHLTEPGESMIFDAVLLELSANTPNAKYTVRITISWMGKPSHRVFSANTLLAKQRTEKSKCGSSYSQLLLRGPTARL